MLGMDFGISRILLSHLESKYVEQDPLEGSGRGAPSSPGLLQNRTVMFCFLFLLLCPLCTCNQHNLNEMKSWGINWLPQESSWEWPNPAKPALSAFVYWLSHSPGNAVAPLDSETCEVYQEPKSHPQLESSVVECEPRTLFPSPVRCWPQDPDAATPSTLSKNKTQQKLEYLSKKMKNWAWNMNETVPAYHSMLPRLTSKENKGIKKEKYFLKMNSSSILGFILINYFL